MNLELAQLLRDAGPWGQGFSEPSFDGVFKVRESRVLGDKHLKLSLSQAETPTAIDAIAFNTTDYDWPAGYQQVKALYRLEVNEYRGRRTPQLLIEYIEPLMS